MNFAEFKYQLTLFCGNVANLLQIEDTLYILVNCHQIKSYSSCIPLSGISNEWIGNFNSLDAFVGVTGI